jgi:alanine racemase
MSRPTKISIDLSAIRANCQLVQTLAGASKIVAVIKADAYGHGAVEVAKAIQQQVHMLTVTCLDEALELRAAGLSKPILLLEGCFTEQEITLAAANHCELVLHSDVQIQQLLDSRLKTPINVWLKIDTGMHRLGIMPEDASGNYARLQGSQNVNNIVLMTHFSSADNLQAAYTPEQLRCFELCLQELSLHQGQNIEVSMANSAALLAWPQSHADWVRPGIMLYGVSPFSTAHAPANRLIPAMTFTSQVIALRQIVSGESVGYGNTWTATRPSKIATIAVGYGDGYPRNAKSGTPVYINGQIVPLVGRVSMDLISVDVTDLKDIKLEDTVELWGKNLPVNLIAKHADTIGYELVTRMPSRVQRHYL